MNKTNKYCIAKFIKFVNEELNLNTPFNVSLTKNRTKELRTYAYYDPSRGYIKVYCKNRGLADVLRSIAHELIHHQQNELGKINGQVQDIGGDIEDEANSVAGQIVKKFGYANPKLAIYHSQC